MNDQTLMLALLTGVLSALATGLGAIPVVLTGGDSPKMKGLATGFACGMMLGASVFLVPEGLRHDVVRTVLGVGVGALAVALVERYLDRPEAGPSDPTRRRSVLLFLVMFFHSIPEGTAIGVGFATEDTGFGLTTALAIAIHNIPEGIAISLPMHAAGAGFSRCFGMSVLSSLPQPLLAVPALYFTARFMPLLPWGLGFAAGAMLFVALKELYPEARQQAGPRQANVCVLVGLIGMGICTLVLDSLF